MLFGVLMPQFQRSNIGQYQLFFAFKLITHQGTEYLEVHIQQGR